MKFFEKLFLKRKLKAIEKQIDTVQNSTKLSELDKQLRLNKLIEKLQTTAYKLDKLENSSRNELN